MKEFTITQKDNGRKLEKWLAAVTSDVSYGQICRFLRLRRVRVNGKPAKEGTTLTAGDTVNVYIEDACFQKKPKENKLLSAFKYHLDILYEDENILLIDKRPGMRVHPDDEEKINTLITHIQAYLYQKGEYSGEGFAPALCNRIDRFTGGIVIAAKNAEALRVMDQKVRNREIAKFYLCAVAGHMKPESGALKNYLVKEGKRVKALRDNTPGAQYAETRYRTLSRDGESSLLECELVTGRTHQIRAQFAAAGHPLLGDTQYGDPKINEKYASRFQQLYACRLEFRFATDSGILNYLNGQSFRVKKLHHGFEEIEKRSVPQ